MPIYGLVLDYNFSLTMGVDGISRYTHLELDCILSKVKSNVKWAVIAWFILVNDDDSLSTSLHFP